MLGLSAVWVREVDIAVILSVSVRWGMFSI